MKTLYTIFIITLSLVQASAQEQWFEDEAIWHYNLSAFWNGQGYEKMSIAGDTVINGIECKILQSDAFTQRYNSDDTLYFDYGEQYVYQAGFEIWGITYGSFKKLYDMRGYIGDTLHYMNLPFLRSNVNIIHDTGTKAYDQKELKYQTVGIYEEGDLVMEIEIVEKLGVITYPFSLFWDDYRFNVSDQKLRSLRCYSSAEIETVMLNNFACEELRDANSSVEETDSEGVIGYPNPVLNYYTLKIPENIERVSIYDELGTLLKTMVPSNYSHSTKIDFTGFKTGSYFVEAVSENKIIINKVVKIR